jgi:thioredoxin-like negative regulator of GroEL
LEGTVNCDNEKELAQKYGIKGFPTMKVFNVGVGNKNSAEEYQSGRDAKSIVDYAM